MADNEAKLKDRVAELERVVKAIASGLVKLNAEIYDDSGEEMLPEGKYYDVEVKY